MNKIEQVEIEQVKEEDIKKFIKAHGLDKKLGIDQQVIFIETCKTANLNPWKTEIYATVYSDRNTGKAQLKTVTAYTVYLQRAEASGLLNGWDTKMVTEAADKRGEKCVITIYRKDRERPFSHAVYMKEYVGNGGLWKNKPVTMLTKVATSQGFRLCFPLQLASMPYTAEEMPESFSEHAVKPKTQETAQETPIKKSPPVKFQPEPTVVNTVKDAENFVQKQKTPLVKKEKVNPKEILSKKETDPFGALEAKFKFPMVITDFAKDLGFEYLYEEKEQLMDYPVPLLPESRKMLKSLHAFIVTRIFVNNQEEQKIPLFRGLLAALSGEPRTSYWTRQNLQCYRKNLVRLHRAAGNPSFNEACDGNADYITEQFIEFAIKLAKEQINKVLEKGNFDFSDHRYSTNNKKELTKLYMDYFLPLPQDSDPTFLTICQQRQSISGGRKGMSKGTSLYEGKITKEQAETFCANVSGILSTKQELINKIFAAGGWNCFGLPNLTKQNFNIVQPVLAIFARALKKSYA